MVIIISIHTVTRASKKNYNLQVRDRFELRVLGGVEILLGHHHSLLSNSILYFY